MEDDMDRYILVPKKGYNPEEEPNENSFEKIMISSIDDIPMELKKHDPERFKDDDYFMYDAKNEALISNVRNEPYIAVVPEYANQKYSPLKKKMFESASKSFILKLSIFLKKKN